VRKKERRRTKHSALIFISRLSKQARMFSFSVRQVLVQVVAAPSSTRRVRAACYSRRAVQAQVPTAAASVKVAMMVSGDD
jgi:hypothetical protein